MNNTLAIRVSSLAVAKAKAQLNGKIVIVEEESDPRRRFICRNLTQGKTDEYYVMNTWRHADNTNAVFYCADSLSEALAFVNVGLKTEPAADKQEAA